MTEKRFVEQNLENHLNKIYDNQKGKVVFDEDICDLLNDLHEENLRLKNKMKRQDNKIRNQRKDLQKFTTYLKDELNMSMDRICDEVFK